jgi:hypothetical protein
VAFVAGDLISVQINTAPGFGSGGNTELRWTSLYDPS